MRIAACTRFGPPSVIEFRTVPDPTPGPNDLIVRVHATTVTSADARIRAMRMPSPTFTLLGHLAFGFRSPRNPVLGSELAGVVERVGANVTTFAPGDRVLAFTGARLGAHAELVRVAKSSAVVKLPTSLSFEHAAALPFAFTTALYHLRDLARFKPGQHITIIGAAGAVGSAAVQLARLQGCTVTAVCRSSNHALVRSLGAQEVIDYTREDWTKHPRRPDIIFDTVGVVPWKTARTALAPAGIFLQAVITMRDVIPMLLTARNRTKPRFKAGIAPERASDLSHIITLASEQKIQPVIGHRYDFNDIANAHALVDSGRKVGAAVVVINER
ncbi:MAG: NAD(P)-dependent alcohol dehydrogenase [Phycisphaerales bacterium]|nr:NAD(P)-dependent alcohol dehydrogenase [Phycisphaerales bacterium]